MQNRDICCTITPRASARLTTSTRSIDRPAVKWVATCNPAADGMADNHSAKSRSMASQIRA